MFRPQNWGVRLALVVNMTGLIMLGLTLALLPPTILSHIDQGWDQHGFFLSLLVMAVLGTGFFATTRSAIRNVHFGHREAFLIVGWGWLAASILGALPYWFSVHLAVEPICHPGLDLVGADFCTLTHSAFESVSGFTTTGATIMTDGLWGEPGLTPDGRPGLPRGLLLWRSMTQYLGGMGIIVLGVAILPLLGVGGMQLFKAEAPGPTTDKLAPRIGETAKLLWKVYLIFTAILFSLLSGAGMDAFEAVCHAMTTMASGGFSTRATSIMAFDSPFIEWTITLFMLIAGINFTLHYLFPKFGPRVYWRDPEWRVYGWTTFFMIGIVTAALILGGTQMGFEESLRKAAFQVVSILTTTGYASTDYELWSFAPTALICLIFLMFVGGMSGSTSGGFKVVRHLLLVKIWIRELFLVNHPHAVRPIRLGSRAVPEDVIRSVSAFCGAYIALLAMGVGFFCIQGEDLMTAFAVSAATLGNVGPGLGDIGPMESYAALSTFSKWICMLLMILGRLEIFTLLVFLSPAFWRR